MDRLGHRVLKVSFDSFHLREKDDFRHAIHNAIVRDCQACYGCKDMKVERAADPMRMTEHAYIACGQNPKRGGIIHCNDGRMFSYDRRRDEMQEVHAPKPFAISDLDYDKAKLRMTPGQAKIAAGLMGFDPGSSTELGGGVVYRDNDMEPAWSRPTPRRNPDVPATSGDAW